MFTPHCISKFNFISEQNSKEIGRDICTSISVMPINMYLYWKNALYVWDVVFLLALDIPNILQQSEGKGSGLSWSNLAIQLQCTDTNGRIFPKYFSLHNTYDRIMSRNKIFVHDMVLVIVFPCLWQRIVPNPPQYAADIYSVNWRILCHEKFIAMEQNPLLYPSLSHLNSVYPNLHTLLL
jgi:hypothetical protein